MADAEAKYDTKKTAKTDDYEQRIVDESLREFSELQTWRATFASHWEEVAELILPTSRNTFYYSNFNQPGVKKTDRQIDSTAMMALDRFSAICDSLLTPRNMQWHGLRADNEYVMKDRATQLWFEDTTKRLFRERYKASAGFSQANVNDYIELGAFGNAGLLIDALDPILSGGHRGLRYRHIGLGGLFFRENHQGVIDGIIYWFKLTAQQCKLKYPDTFPETLNVPLQQNSQMTYDFILRIVPRYDFDPTRKDYKGMRYAAYHIFPGARKLLKEGGYRSFPIAASRFNQTPGEVYGRGWAMSVLPTIKTLNNMKAVYLKQVHLNADPILLTADDGVVSMQRRPGAVNKGGVDSQGRELVKILPTGNIQVAKEMMDGEAQIINDAAFITLFQILVKTPQMSATEVIERMNEKGILIAPVLGRQQSERLGSMIPRELDVLSQQGLLLPMPPRLREAGGEYEIVFTNPLSRAAKAQEAAGFMRTLEGVKELVNITQDHSLLDPFNFDVAVPAIAEIQSVPPSWMATNDQIAAKRKNRAAAMQQQQQIQALPAQAAMVKAQAVAAKAGQAQAPVPPGQQPAQPGPPLTQSNF